MGRGGEETELVARRSVLYGPRHAPDTLLAAKPGWRGQRRLAELKNQIEQRDYEQACSLLCRHREQLDSAPLLGELADALAHASVQDRSRHSLHDERFRPWAETTAWQTISDEIERERPHHREQIEWLASEDELSPGLIGNFAASQSALQAAEPGPIAWCAIAHEVEALHQSGRISAAAAQLRAAGTLEGAPALRYLAEAMLRRAAYMKMLDSGYDPRWQVSALARSLGFSPPPSAHLLGRSDQQRTPLHLRADPDSAQLLCGREAGIDWSSVEQGRLGAILAAEAAGELVSDGLLCKRCHARRGELLPGLLAHPGFPFLSAEDRKQILADAVTRVEDALADGQAIETQLLTRLWARAHHRRVSELASVALAGLEPPELLARLLGEAEARDLLAARPALPLERLEQPAIERILIESYERHDLAARARALLA